MIFKPHDILIVGSNGLLGVALSRVFGEKAIGLNHNDIEITDFQCSLELLMKFKPKVVIHTAAMVKSEECEEKPLNSLQINSIGSYNIALAAKKIDAKVVYFSTDYVFDGSKIFFTEYDPPNPINIYGSSKLFGEYLVKIANPSHYIVRSSWFFGTILSTDRFDFPHRMLEKGKKVGEISVVNDQFGSPTFTYDLALKIKEILENDAPFGIYHITNEGSCSWYEYAKKCFEYANVKWQVNAINTSQSGTVLKRPKYSILKNLRLIELGYNPMRPWKEALKDYFSQSPIF